MLGPEDSPNPGIEPRSPALWADSLLSEPPGRQRSTEPGLRALTPGEVAALGEGSCPH